jgi:hypothetical protein
MKTILVFFAVLQCFKGYAQTPIIPTKPHGIKTEITYSILNKPSSSEMEDIEDWLIQFTLVCDNEVYYYDAEVSKLYGEADPRRAR